MPYTCNLGEGRQLYLANQDQQTLVTLISISFGQQQSQSSSFSTGAWTSPPTVLLTNIGLTIRIETAQGQAFIQVQGNSIQAQVELPSFVNADILPLQHLDQPDPPKGSNSGFSPMPSMPPMQPMPPMRMGNMEMQMNPMHMRIGDMELQMPAPQSPASSQQASTKKFCSNCGTKVKESDCFCSSCGHQL